MNAAVFHQAVCDGDATRVKFLINLGQQARVNQVNKQGLTALQQSCKDGKLDVVHVLLNHGANTGLTGRINKTALHLAASGGHKAIVELLISSCTQLSCKDEDGNLPVDVAKTEEIKELLKKAELDKKAKNVEGNKRKTSGVDEWGQSLNNLPPGSRNSLVSNSSSDSGVFTDPDSTSTNTGQTQHRRNTRSRSFSGYENQRRALAMGVLNEWEEGTHERGLLSAQTTGGAKQTNLRRSNSERLPAHQRRRTLRKLSEELSALNLQRSAVQEYREADENNSEDLSNVHHNRVELRGHENKDYSKPHYVSCGLGSVNVEQGKNDNEYIICAKQVQPIVTINEEKDEGWEDGDDMPDSPPPVLLGRVRDDKTGQLREIACDELDLCRRSQRNARGSRRQTVEVCERSHVKTSERNAQSWMNAQQQQQQKQNYTDSFLFPDVNQVDSVGTCPNLTRSMSSCSDSEIRKYYRRLQKTKEMNNMAYRSRRYTYDCVPEKRTYQDIYQTKDGNNNIDRLPGYDETVRRLNNERAATTRRPNSRQISQV